MKIQRRWGWRALLAAVLLSGSGCVGVTSEVGAPDGGDSQPPCQCSLPQATCVGSSRVAPFAARCLKDGGCEFLRQETFCDQGCDGGTCVGDPCKGVVCNQPPAAKCTSPTSLRVYPAAGACQGGGCLYSGTEVSCACANGRCQDDPCAGQSCTNPPAAVCVGGAVRSYASPGSCDKATGTCTYASTDTPCGAGGCSCGQCVSDKCAGVTCNQPPAPTCVDPATALTWSTPGACDPSTGVCSYQSKKTSCPVGQQCSLGACSTPPPSCNASNCAGCCNGTSCVAPTAQTNGQCGSGGAACAACGAGTPVCQSGTCVSLCSGVTCTQPPAPSCLDAVTLKQFSSPGTCDPSTGVCTYASTSTLCPAGKFCSAGQCVEPAWTQRSPVSSPPARRWPAVAFDGARQRVVLFGGMAATNGARLSDTWEWDGTSWTRKSPTSSPSARYSHAMAYDGARERVVLFGGDGNTNFGDTWEWDGNNWTQKLPTSNPSARRAQALAYDTARQRVILFGGYDGSRALEDTWTYGF